MTTDRRTFLQLVEHRRVRRCVRRPPSGKALAIPAHHRTGTIDDVEHIVILMQENRSFDHYFGTLRGVRGFGDPRAGEPAVRRAGVAPAERRRLRAAVPPDARRPRPAVPRGPAARLDRHARGLERRQVRPVGAEQGHARTMAYLTRKDIPFHYALADAFTVCDAYHCSFMGATDPNRYHMWTGWVGNDGAGRRPGARQRRGGLRLVDLPRAAASRPASRGRSTRTPAPASTPAGFWGWGDDAYIGNYGDNSLLYFHQYQNAAPGSPLFAGRAQRDRHLHQPERYERTRRRRPCTARLEAADGRPGRARGRCRAAAGLVGVRRAAPSASRTPWARPRAASCSRARAWGTCPSSAFLVLCAVLGVRGRAADAGRHPHAAGRAGVRRDGRATSRSSWCPRARGGGSATSRRSGPRPSTTSPRAVRAGLSLPEALAGLAVRGPEPLRPSFEAFALDYQVTGRFGECLDRLKARLADPVGDRVVEGLRVAREVGGGELGRLLRNLSGYLRDEARTRSELEARQAWTVNGARLAVAAPVARPADDELPADGDPPLRVAGRHARAALRGRHLRGRLPPDDAHRPAARANAGSCREPAAGRGRPRGRRRPRAGPGRRPGAGHPSTRPWRCGSLPYVRDVPAAGPRRPRWTSRRPRRSPQRPGSSARCCAPPPTRSSACSAEPRPYVVASSGRRLDKTVHDFRIEQVLWGLAGFAVVAAYCLLTTLGGGGGTRVVAAAVRRRVRDRRAGPRHVPDLPGDRPRAQGDRRVPRAGRAAGARGRRGREPGRRPRPRRTPQRRRALPRPRRVLAAVRTGEPVAHAFDRMAATTGVPSVARFAQGVAVAVERGTPLADVLHAQAADVREAEPARADRGRGAQGDLHDGAGRVPHPARHRPDRLLARRDRAAPDDSLTGPTEKRNR